MNWQFTPVALLYLAAVLISFGLAARSWRMRPARGAFGFTFLTLSTGLWALGYLLGFFSTQFTWKLAMLRLEYLGICGAAYFFALFCLTYANLERWLNRFTVAALAIIPLAALLLVLTVERHNLFYRSYTLIEAYGLVLTRKVYGPGFWTFATYNYAVVTIGSLILIRAVLRFPALFQGQAVTLVAATVIPLISNFLYLSRANPFAPYDPSAIAFTVAGILIMVSMGRYKFLSIAPVAHDLVFKSINSGVIVLDAGGRIVEINPAAQRMLLRSESEAVGKMAREVFPEYDEQITQFRDMLDTLTEVSLQDSIYELQISPLYNRTAALSGRIVMLHDITQRKQADDRLRLREQQYRRLVEESSDVVYTLDLDGRFTYINRPIRNLTGYPEDKLEGKRLTELLVHPGYVGYVEQALKRQREERVPEGLMEFQIVTGYGEVKWLEQVVTLVEQKGEVSGFQCSAREVTQRKKEEDERERLIAELDAFAHTVAHDLKNPVHVIGGYAELLLMDSDRLAAEARLDMLQSIQRVAARMEGIIDGLMVLSGVRKMGAVTLTRLDMAYILAGTRDQLEPLIAQKAAKITQPEGWPEAFGYAPWVGEVWVNYISNALKYGGDPPLVELGGKVDPGGEYTRFWVRDNGRGLSPEEQSRLFTPFSRLGQVQVEGHGLGLSIVQRIVNRLGGDVGVESNPGEGSTFWFTLPKTASTDSL